MRLSKKLLPTTRLVMGQEHRLRYWQEKLLERFSVARFEPLPRPSPADLITALRVCPVHSLPLQQGTVAVFHGCVDYTPRYLVTRQQDFPHSAVDPVSTEGTPFDGDECAIWICSGCQAAAIAYHQRTNLKVGPQLATDRYTQLKELGLDALTIVRQLRQELALSIGEAKEIILRFKADHPLIRHQEALLEQLNRDFEDASLPRPDFQLDEEVETVGDQHTYRRGFIRDSIWHHKHKTWHYYLTVGGKKASKRYGPADLRKTCHSE